MGTCPGFDATMKASATGYRAGPPIGAPVPPARRAPPSTLPHCGHPPMADNPSAVTALIS